LIIFNLNYKLASVHNDLRGQNDVRLSSKITFKKETGAYKLFNYVNVWKYIIEILLFYDFAQNIGYSVFSLATQCLLSDITINYDIK